jgi:hypothetical protein
MFQLTIWMIYNDTFDTSLYILLYSILISHTGYPENNAIAIYTSQIFTQQVISDHRNFRGK